MKALNQLGSLFYYAAILALCSNFHSALAQIPQAYASELPVLQARISSEPDETRRTILRGNTHPLATVTNDRGSVTPDHPMRRILTLLRRSDEQQKALESLLASQQDPGSPLFHHWLTPEQYGTWFGPADQDVQAVENWLTSRGFVGVTINKGRTVIEFSGTAGQVESAFQTAIHQYEVKGAMHIANRTDPSIPSSLIPVIEGLVSLNDFGRRSMAVQGATLRSSKDSPIERITPEANPLFTVPGPTPASSFYGLSPYDFATIYDLLPLWNAGFDGTGQTIAIVGDTDINVTDVEQFRALFGLPANNPTVLISGIDPGIQPDEIEADLDVEWSGAIAKGARVQLVSSASTETTAGVDLSALYIVDNNLAPVMSESYGECELFLGSAANAFVSSLWQQAAAEGITVLVSSGDQGSTVCDPTNSTQNLAVHPMAVNGLASTPYNIAVGGTDFNQYGRLTQYWSNTNDPKTKQSVLGYIPEIPWNDSCGSTVLDAIMGDSPSTACNSGNSGASNLNTIASSGGPSSCIRSNGVDPSTCTGGWPKPAWQAGNGVPADGVRDVPDVSLFASNGVYSSAYVVCEIDRSLGSGCDPTASAQTFLGVGGTSGGAPAMAGVMAIINQKYGRQGNANVTLYRLAASNKATSIFHDITIDGNRVACTPLSSDCVIPPGSTQPIGTTKGHDSTAGYDMVTGLGSVDISNLVNNWTAVGFTPTTSTLTLNGGTGVVTAVHGSAINASVGVTASTGTPGGNVSLVGAATSSASFVGTLQNGILSSTVNSLPGGNYTVSAHYSGDTQFAPSDSNAIAVKISPEPSTTKLSVLNYDTTRGTFVPASSVVYGSYLLLRADVKGQSGNGVATGPINLTDGNGTLGTFALNSQGSTENAPNSVLLAGAHELTAAYMGDSSFNASNGKASIAITAAPMTCSLQPNTTYLRPGWVVVLSPNAGLYQAKPAPPLGEMVAPTGTFSIYSGSKLVAGPTVVTGHGGAIIPQPGITTYSLPDAYIDPITLQISQLASITFPITAVYSGDPNYVACTSSPVVLSYQTAPLTPSVSFTLPTYQGIQVGTPITVTANVSASDLPVAFEPPYPVPGGSVQLAVDGVKVGSPAQLMPGASPSLNPSGTATITIQTTNLSVGMHTLMLTYGGDSNYAVGSLGQVGIWLVVPDFSITASPSNLVVANGQTTPASTIQVAANNGFTGTVNFSCSGLPSGATCSFSPQTVTVSGSTSLTITTVKAQMIAAGPIAINHPRKSMWAAETTGIVSAWLVFLLVPRRRRKGVLACLAAAGAILFGVTSCGGGSGAAPNPGPISSTTTVSLGAASTTPAKGASDPFTATILGAGSPSGTIQFSVDAASSGSPVPVVNGMAQIAMSFSTAGQHTVSAAYSGDSTHTSSTSQAFTVNVPYTTGSIPGSYNVTITASSGSLSRSMPLSLMVQ